MGFMVILWCFCGGLWWFVWQFHEVEWDPIMNMNTTMVIYCYIAATYYNYGNYGGWIASRIPTIMMKSKPTYWYLLVVLHPQEV